MKINRIKLVDWRNHPETDLALERLTCIRGANHTGKSSIAQAIEFALTGRCEGTDARGAGSLSLIRQGSDKAVVLMRVQSNREIDVRCALTEKSGRSVTIRDEKDPAWTGENVKAYFDNNREVLSCLLNSRYFIGLKAADQKTLLASVMLPDAYQWPQWAVDAAKDVYLQINWNQAPFTVIEQAHKAAFDKRRDINRDLKNLHVPEQPEAPAFSLESANDALALLRAEIGDMERQLRSKSAEYGRTQEAISALRTRIESLEAKERNEHQLLTSAGDEVLSAKALKDAQKIVAGESKRAKLQSQKIDAEAEVAKINGVISLFDQLDGRSVCPTCAREVTPEWLAEAMKPHSDALDKANAKVLDAMRGMKELGDIDGAIAKINNHERAQANVRRSRAVIAETEALLKTARAELEDLSGKLSTMAAPEADPQELIDLRKEVSRMEQQRVERTAYETRMEEIDRAKKQKEKLTKAHTQLESLLAYFGQDGVKAEMLAQHLGGFLAGVNEALAAWGYSVTISMEPYALLVKNLATDAQLPVEFLSGSERLRFSVAFQVALSVQTGIGLVVIDEADVLDAEGRSGLYPMLLASSLDQAIVIGTDERTEVPEVEGAVFYAMHDGRCVELVAEVEDAA